METENLFGNDHPEFISDNENEEVNPEEEAIEVPANASKPVQPKKVIKNPRIKLDTSRRNLNSKHLSESEYPLKDGNFLFMDDSSFRRMNYSLSSLIKAVNCTRRGISVTTAARKYEIPQASLRKYIVNLKRNRRFISNVSKPCGKDKRFLLDWIKGMLCIGKDWSWIKTELPQIANYIFKKSTKNECTELTPQWVNNFISKYFDMSVVASHDENSSKITPEMSIPVNMENACGNIHSCSYSTPLSQNISKDDTISYDAVPFCYPPNEVTSIDHILNKVESVIPKEILKVYNSYYREDRNIGDTSFQMWKIIKSMQNRTKSMELPTFENQPNNGLHVASKAIHSHGTANIYQTPMGLLKSEMDPSYKKKSGPMVIIHKMSDVTLQKFQSKNSTSRKKSKHKKSGSRNKDRGKSSKNKNTWKRKDEKLKNKNGQNDISPTKNKDSSKRKLEDGVPHKIKKKKDGSSKTKVQSSITHKVPPSNNTPSKDDGHTSKSKAKEKVTPVKLVSPFKVNFFGSLKKKNTGNLSSKKIDFQDEF